LYECKCGRKLEISHTITEDPEINCNECEGKMQRKITGVGAINFKGNGFYSKDNK